ncbi:histidine kinase [Streptomyces sp. BV333]|uniref:sensor histidine kinase n=1 Tax=Streptomyces sp. BV333 TaxID=2849673 RepID=UPI0027DEDAB2|nr:histidine kinase [Streptomyces sp. BV333]
MEEGANDAKTRWILSVRKVLRPEGRPDARALLVDTLLAVALAVVGIIASWKFQPVDYMPGVNPQDAPTHVPRGGRPHYWLIAVNPLPLALRRRYPLPAFWAAVGLGLLLGSQATWITLAVCALAAYSAIGHSRRRVLASASLVIAAALSSFAFHGAAPELPGWSAAFVIMLLAAVVAATVRHWQDQFRASQRHVAALQTEKREAARKAVEEERARITAELHDVVSHNVSVMVIQAGAAHRVLDAAPEEARKALHAVEASGRAAMAELRAVMSLFAAPLGSVEGLQPQPGLDQLETLVDGVRATGMPVDLKMSLPPEPLPPGIELAAYRVVQEALTNSLKHAAGASASVVLRHDEEWLEIEVTDTGGTRTEQASSGNGRGLIGLRERLAAYGGSLEARHRLGGGFVNQARLPWRST